MVSYPRSGTSYWRVNPTNKIQQRTCLGYWDLSSPSGDFEDEVRGPFFCSVLCDLQDCEWTPRCHGTRSGFRWQRSSQRYGEAPVPCRNLSWWQGSCGVFGLLATLVAVAVALMTTYQPAHIAFVLF